MTPIGNGFLEPRLREPSVIDMRVQKESVGIEPVTEDHQQQWPIVLCCFRRISRSPSLVICGPPD
ncbi:hypothetical protein BDP55DRAFT_666621 [Colletotrichum godetiae]|uniref:Uncharacterized protein n=1 Tax=Colletotrichum godetiae TaxID=1209918 RepID=A0AAJ0AML2_9PEZI|nr:uncharacterized protein BDP55DRAFT_666621 [Colletotrichum godetiae]KAK1674491.1 hypothetical protein BDP55DRAFT_666621 [Colletotrichum godetiae]